MFTITSREDVCIEELKKEIGPVNKVLVSHDCIFFVITNF